jgi:outer membrane protein insertion porin family
LFDDRFTKENTPNLTSQEKYRWIEYHKWKITSSWFTQLVGNLVLNTRVGYGFLGSYNKYLGSAPFERFNLGGSGLSTGGSFGFLLGREIIALRGYDDESVSPQSGAPFIGKYTAELRYPFSLNPSATIYGLAFVEAGNTWINIKDFNPFNVKRSAGVGIRIFLPMFGMLGLDWGYRFDDTPEYRPQSKRHQIHFTIGTNIGNL